MSTSLPTRLSTRIRIRTVRVFWLGGQFATVHAADTTLCSHLDGPFAAESQVAVLLLVNSGLLSMTVLRLSTALRGLIRLPLMGFTSDRAKCSCSAKQKGQFWRAARRQRMAGPTCQC